MSLGFNSIYIYLYSLKINHLNFFDDFKIELLTINLKIKMKIFMMIKFISKRRCKREI